LQRSKKMAGSKKCSRTRKKQKRQPPDAAAAPADGANPTPKAQFEEWLDFEGVDWDSCTLADTAGMGQGVLAARDIQEGEVVLSVPDDAVLMPDDCCIAQVSLSQNADKYLG